MNALALLRNERPEAHIAWAVEDRFADLLAGHPHIDELITVPRKRWGRMLKNPLRWPEFVRELRHLASRLREGRFDASVDFQSSLKSAWMVRAACAELRLGFAPPVSRELSHLVQNRLVKSPREGVHRIERDLALLAPLGIRTRYVRPTLPCRPENANVVDAALDDMLTGGPLVVIHPGTSAFASFKRWVPGRYARVADQLIEERGADVIVSWGPADRDVAEEVVLLMRRRGHLAPRTADLQQLVRLLQRADLFIGSDTGPMHVASAVGTPVVALFGPKDPVQTGPYCSRSLVVTGRAACRPCTRRRCSHVRCMTSISSTQVLKAALDVLDGAGECRGRPEPIRKPFTWAFRLGPRRGEVNTAYSGPAFFTWLCELEHLLHSPDAAPLPTAAGRTMASLPNDLDFGPWRLLVEQYRHGKGRARRAWRTALGTAAAPRPVCWMRGPGARGRSPEVAVFEHQRGLRPLNDFVGGPPGEGPAWWQTGVLNRVAKAVRALHLSNVWHRDLRAHNILVGDAAVGARVLPTGRSRSTRRVPPPARHLLRGLDLGMLAADLGAALPDEGADRLLDLYCTDLADDARSRRMLARAFRWRKETQSWLKRFL
ncbi:MAG: glycosyltransferase family 9 protein [Candidatus Brocadiia bacterium]